MVIEMKCEIWEFNVFVLSILSVFGAWSGIINPLLGLPGLIFLFAVIFVFIYSIIVE